MSSVKQTDNLQHLPHSNQHPVGAHFLNVHTIPPNHYQLGTKHSNEQTCGGLSAFKPQRSGSSIAISMPRIPLHKTAKCRPCLSRDEWTENMWCIHKTLLTPKKGANLVQWHKETERVILSYVKGAHHSRQMRPGSSYLRSLKQPQVNAEWWLNGAKGKW